MVHIHKSVFQDKTNVQGSSVLQKGKKEIKEEIEEERKHHPTATIDPSPLRIDSCTYSQEIENVLPYEEEIEENAEEIFRETEVQIEDILDPLFFI